MEKEYDEIKEYLKNRYNDKISEIDKVFPSHTRIVCGLDAEDFLRPTRQLNRPARGAVAGIGRYDG